jgi:DsbC/DsbD-like thiol-disulfide interchange protein
VGYRLPNHPIVNGKVGDRALHAKPMLDRRALLSCLAVLAVPQRASAAPVASDWSRDLKSAVRLIAASPVGSDGGLVYRAGLQVMLDPGTKTYWRTPGDSGVPPVFDWSGSDNVADVALAWPAPVRFPDGNGYSIGYKTGVVFPLKVSPRDPARPVMLALKLDYAVCDQICIPAKGEARLGLGLRSDVDDTLAGLVAQYEARVPVTAASGLAVKVTSVERGGQHPIVRIEAQVGAEPGHVDLFAEGPDSRWALPLPEPLDAQGPLRRFKLVLDGAPRGTDPLAHDLTFTLVAGTRALETKLRPA